PASISPKLRAQARVFCTREQSHPALEEPRGSIRRSKAQVSPRRTSCHAPAGRARNHASAHKIGPAHFLNGGRFFANSNGKSTHANRPTAVALNQCAKHCPVQAA